MNYSIGDCVKNMVKKNYANGDIIVVNTRGIVLKVFTLSKSYKINFEGANMPHRVLETQIEGC